MKKTLVLVLTVGTVAFTACKKNKPEADGNGNIYELPYNKEGITANKAFMESEGRDLIKKVDDLSTNTAIKAFESLGNLQAPEIDIAVNSLTKIGTENQKIAAINSALTEIATVNTIEESSYKLSKAFGIYKFNPSNGDWDKTASNDKIEFHFPSVKGGNTNNAILTITYKNSGKSVVFRERKFTYTYHPDRGYYETVDTVESTYELPSEIKGRLTIGGNEAMTLTSNYAYHNDNLPQSVDVVLALGAYTAKLGANNSNTEAKVKFSFAKGAETLIDVDANSNFNTISYNKLKTAKDDELADLIIGANTTLKVGNLTLAGYIDFKTVNNILKPISDREPKWDDYMKGITYPNFSDFNGNYTLYQIALDEYFIKSEEASQKYKIAYEKHDKEFYTAFANVLNKNSAVVLANTKTNKKIASVTFQLGEDKYEFFNGTKTITNYYYDIEPLLVFGDGSKIDFETFGDTGFQKLIDDIESLVNKFDR